MASTIEARSSDTATVLDDQGYQVIDSFLDPETCSAYLSRIDQFRKENELNEIFRPVAGRSLRYFVINGEQIKGNLKDIWDLYLGDMREEVNQRSGRSFEPLSNVRVGVNINIMPPGRSEYRWHYDRTRMTAILYLNDVEAGETIVYPNYRILLRKRGLKRLQHLVDNCLEPAWVRERFAEKKVIAPRAGRLLIMRGNRCWHSVRGVKGREDRLNIILAYDLPGTTFPMEKGLDSYLYTREEASSAKDPNYG